MQVFNFNRKNGTPVRVQVINGEPWFVAKDVCHILDISNHIDAVSRLDEDERMDGVGITDPIGRKQQVNAVNESGLYHLIFQSRKAEARKFRRWVTGELLPALRRTGRYELKPRSRVLPKERSAELAAFYRELTKWVTREDEKTIAEKMHVSAHHVHEVLVGRRPGYGVTCMLVEQARENRALGVRRVDVSAAGRGRLVEELRLEFMEDFNGEEE